MSDQTTYKPLVTAPENDYKLVKTSRGTEKEIRKIEVRFAGNDIDMRKGICDIEKWEYEEHIPELSYEPRLGLDALRKLMERTDEDSEQELRNELNKVIVEFGVQHERVESISADEYWTKMAGLLFVGFDAGDVNPDDLDFKEIQRAYQDFF